MSFLSKVYSRFSSVMGPDKWYMWIFFLFLFRIPFIYYQVYVKSLPLDACIVQRYDVSSYVCPVENFIAWGRWEPSIRLPGYSLIYLIFRIFLPMWHALFAMIIFQSLVGCITAYLLSKSVYEISKSKALFFILICLLGLNIYVLFWEGNILTDSLSANFIGISLYFISQYSYKRATVFLLYSGLFLGWSAFMRPANVLAFPFYIPLIMQLSNIRSSLWKNLFIFSLPYGLFMLSFQVTHYIYKGELYRPRYFDIYEHPYAKKLLIVHGSICWPNMEINLFPAKGQNCSIFFGQVGVFGDSIVKIKSSEYISSCHNPNIFEDCFGDKEADPVTKYLSKCICTSIFSIDSIRAIRYDLQKIAYANEKNIDSLSAALNHKISRYIESVKRERPVYYYITSRIKSFILLITNGQAHFRGHTSFPQVPWLPILLTFHTIPITLYLILFAVSIFVCLKTKNNLMLSFLVLTLAGPGIIFSYIFISLPQVRYLVSAYPYVFWGLAVEIHLLHEYFINRKSTNQAL